MSIQLHKAIKICFEITDRKNQHSRTGDRIDEHEDLIASILDKCGFSEIKQITMSYNKKNKLKKELTFKKLCSKNIKVALKSDNTQLELKKLVPDMPPGTYIRQPAGSQSTPDFLIHDFDKRIILIEAKSGNGSIPTWNGSLPKSDIIYIFTSAGFKDTTVFLGQDVISNELETLLTDFHDKLQKESRKLNMKLSNLDIYNRGFNHYVRSKFGQGGGNKITNYFTHEDRDKCEKNALIYSLGR
jgi:hypothetical protein